MTSRKPQTPPGFQYTNNRNEAIEPVWKYEHEKANEAENGRLGWAVFFLGLFVAFVFLLVLGNTARGETYPIRKENIGSASCVCVGRLSNKEQTQSAWVFVTNRHVATVTKRDRNGRIISQRLATLYVGSDDGKWIKARNVQTSSDVDVASFHVLTTQRKFRTIKLLEGGPDGMTATVCGYSPDRRAFCLTGTMNGNKVRGDRGAHVLWGDSGGPVIVEIAGVDYMAGLAYGFGDHDRQTWFVSSEDCCNQLKASYGIAPQCVQYRQICPNGQCRPQPQQMPPGTYR
ncbi:MAG: serine protease, partial [Planctomycetaceae bacterium]